MPDRPLEPGQTWVGPQAQKRTIVQISAGKTGTWVYFVNPPGKKAKGMPEVDFRAWAEYIEDTAEASSG